MSQTADIRDTDFPDTNVLLDLLVRQEQHHALILLDSAGQVLAWLAAAEKLFGYSATETLGRHFSFLFTPEDVQKGMPEHELDVARENGSSEDDRWMLRRDGMRFWASGAVSPIREPQGEIIGFGKILRNRTDVKAQLETLENSIHAWRAGDERKNAFIGTLAHELRNPLASVASAVALLRRGLPQTEEAVFATATIERQANYMRRMVDDLLDVTRIGAGKVQLAKQRVSVADALKAAVDCCRPSLDERTHDFQLVLPSAPVIVEADPARLQQVFVNLIANAAKYTQYGGRVWVKLAVECEEAVIKVEDSGVGISPELLPRIFDMFTQAEFATEKAEGGLGIGLSVVKNLVMQHGGSVQVRSDGIGKGSEFIVRLPLAKEEREQPSEATATLQRERPK